MPTTPVINQNLSVIIMEKALSFGASLVGITTVDLIRNSPSHQQVKNFRCPTQSKSLVVLALKHDITEPSLDWWDGKQGTAGNRQLIFITRQLKKWLKKNHGMVTNDVAYHIHKGGIYLKDAAVYAGIGVIGKNNLLITPSYGPRVRLRALFINAILESNKILYDFSPCNNCEVPCHKACPQKAFEDGSYNRILCQKQMEQDEIKKPFYKNTDTLDYDVECIKYCRACELACPVGLEDTLPDL